MAEFDFVKVLIFMVAILISAKVFGLLFKKIGLPSLIGEIIIGILIATVAINGQTIGEWLNLYEYVDHEGITKRTFTEYGNVLVSLAELGVVFLLFTVGLETRVKDLLSVGKAAMLVAILGVLFPFFLGFVYVKYGYQGGDMNSALFVGAAMVATSVGITARVIKDMKLTDKKESRIIIGAAVIDDILGMIVLAVVGGMTKGEGGLDALGIVKITLVAFGFVILTMIVADKVVPKIHDYFEERNRRKWAVDNNYIPSKFNMVAIAVCTCLVFALIAELIDMAAIIGAFLAGMLFAEYAFEYELEEKFDSICTFLVSFFFVYVGMMVELNGIGTSLIIATVIIVVLAIIGKYVGCGLGAKLGDSSLGKESINIIGIGMIPRGEVGIIIALIGLDSGIIPQELYTVVVLMSVLTTIIAPPLLSIFFRKMYAPEYKIQGEDQL